MNEDDTQDSQRLVVLFDQDIMDIVIVFQIALRSKEVKFRPGTKKMIEQRLKEFEDMERRNMIEYAKTRTGIKEHENKTGYSEPDGPSS